MRVKAEYNSKVGNRSIMIGGFVFVHKVPVIHDVPDDVLQVMKNGEKQKWMKILKIYDSVAETPAAEETPVEEPVAEEVPVEETPVEEPVAEESVEETPVEEPVAEEPAAEEAPVEETPVEETAAKAAPVEETVSKAKRNTKKSAKSDK